MTNPELFKKLTDGNGKPYSVGRESTFTDRSYRYNQGDHLQRHGWTWEVLSARFPLVTARIVK